MPFLLLMLVPWVAMIWLLWRRRQSGHPVVR